MLTVIGEKYRLRDTSFGKIDLNTFFMRLQEQNDAVASWSDATITKLKQIDVLNIKCDPMMIGSLRMKEGFFPAYHMNKENWISILLDGTVSADEIKPLLELSYQLTR